MAESGLEDAKTNSPKEKPNIDNSESETTSSDPKRDDPVAATPVSYAVPDDRTEEKQKDEKIPDNQKESSEQKQSEITTCACSAPSRGALSNTGVKRKLWDVDHEKIDADISNEFKRLKKETEDAKRNWNFDFDEEIPLEGNWQWTKEDNAPTFYKQKETPYSKPPPRTTAVVIPDSTTPPAKASFRSLALVPLQ